MYRKTMRMYRKTVGTHGEDKLKAKQVMTLNGPGGQGAGHNRGREPKRNLAITKAFLFWPHFTVTKSRTA